MGFDSPSLTPRAVDLTPSRLGHCDGSHAEKFWASGLNEYMNIYI